MTDASEIEKEYLSSLSDLNVNSKPLINMLTILAEENIEHGQVIVDAIEKHITKVTKTFFFFYLFHLTRRFYRNFNSISFDFLFDFDSHTRIEIHFIFIWNLHTKAKQKKKTFFFAEKALSRSMGRKHLKQKKNFEFKKLINLGWRSIVEYFDYVTELGRFV